MKTFLALAILATLNVCLVPISQAHETLANAPSKIRIAVDNWPPYQDINSKHYGSAHRIITEAFTNESIDAEYGWFPWSRSLMYAEAGEWDAAALSQYSKERADKFHFSDPIFYVEKVFFHLKDVKFDWNAIEDIKDRTIGAHIGYLFGDDFQEAEEKGDLNVIRLPSNEQCIDMLIRGRIQLYPAELKAGRYLIESKFGYYSPSIVYHPKRIQSVSYHLIVSKKIPNAESFVEAFNKGLKKLKQEGKVDRYIEEGLTGQYEPLVSLKL